MIDYSVQCILYCDIDLANTAFISVWLFFLLASLVFDWFLSKTVIK